jgi:hypothetical protein
MLFNVEALAFDSLPRLRGHAVGDVLECALRADDRARGISHRLTDRPHRDAPALRRDELQFEVVRRAEASAVRNRIAHRHSRLGCIEIEGLLQRQPTARRQVVHRAQLA